MLYEVITLQQDAFDKVDATATLERQANSFNRVFRLVNQHYKFADKDEARRYFTQLTGLYRNLNYSDQETPQYQEYLQQIEILASARRSAAESDKRPAVPH